MHPFIGYPAVKHPKHSRYAITNMREKPVDFFCCSTRASILVFTITLLTQVSVQKFLFLFISIIPCSNALLVFVGRCKDANETHGNRYIWLEATDIPFYVWRFLWQARVWQRLHGWSFLPVISIKWVTANWKHCRQSNLHCSWCGEPVLSSDDDYTVILTLYSELLPVHTLNSVLFIL